jgi:pSer/pThr/pTyr-binding forkhead associated (FHA) protein
MLDNRLARFSEDCGLDGPLLVTINGPPTGGPSAYTFRSPFVLIGRDPASDLVLDHPDVSRRHAYLQVIDGRVFFTDLASRTGIHWAEGPRLSGWIGTGHTIRIGPYDLRLRPDQPASPTSEVDDIPPTSRAFQSPALEAVVETMGAPEHKEWHLSRALVLVGRSVSCKVRLEGYHVSRFHAGLVQTPGGTWAVDLLGRGGFRINGESVRCVRLDEGDGIALGNHRLGFRYTSTSTSTSTSGSTASLQLVSQRKNHLSSVPRVEVSDPLIETLMEQFARMQDQSAERFEQTMLMMFRLFGKMYEDQMGVLREEIARLHAISNERATLPLSPTAGERPVLASIPRKNPALANGEKPPRPKPAIASGVPRADRPQPQPRAELFHSLLNQRLAALRDEQQGAWQKMLRSALKKTS